MKTAEEWYAEQVLELRMFVGSGRTPGQFIRAIQADAIRAAADSVRYMKRCPFEDRGFTMDPATPCPICCDRGDDLNAKSNCSNAADAILALIPEQVK